MAVDLAGATSFLTTHGRLLDRRRLGLFRSEDTAEGVMDALDAYRNADGGFGWGLEPDLRSTGSQPAGALHAFEVLAEIGPTPSTDGAALCEWLDANSLPDGGLPFALPIADPAGCSPFWVEADPTAPSLQITAAVTAQAHRVARHDNAVAAQPWLARATDFCLAAIAESATLPAYVLSFSLQFLDELGDTRPEAGPLLERLVGTLADDASIPVEGGLDGERLHPLDLSPWPHRPSRSLIAPAVIAADLERLAGLQQDDGGWTVDFATSSPAAALEWRGYATVKAISVLRANADGVLGRLPGRNVGSVD